MDAVIVDLLLVVSCSGGDGESWVRAAIDGNAAERDEALTATLA